MNPKNSLNKIANIIFLLKILVFYQINPQNALSDIDNSNFLLKLMVNYQIYMKI